MLRILHITTDFLPGIGGLERFVRDLAVNLQSRNISSTVLCLNRVAGDDRRLPATDVCDGIPVHRVGFLNLKYYKPVILPLPLLRSVDILHVHGIGAHLDFTVAAKLLHRKPIILSTHGGIFHTTNQSTLKNIYFTLVRSLILPHVNRIIASGESDRQLFVDHGVSNLQTIDNGIDLHAFADTSVPRQSARFIFVGRIAPSKQIDLLIRALAELRQTGTVATLRIVGPDRYKLTTELQQLSQNLGVGDSVTFAPNVSDEILAQEFLQADVFVSASRHEGFGISAVEALAAGCPLILNDIPAFRYLLKNSPAGHLVDFTQPPLAAAALRDLLSTDRSALRPLARHRAADFSWDHLIPQWATVYESACHSA